MARDSEALPIAPRRVLIGADSHAKLAELLHAARPELELRGSKVADVSPGDLEWADAYLGFRRPPLPSMGNVRWVHSTGAGVDVWLYPTELSQDILLTRSSESFGPMIAEWALARALAFTQHIVALASDQGEKKWAPRHPEMLATTNAVVVGTGDVGTHVARLFAALGCHITGVSRSGAPADSAFHSVVPVARLAEVVADAHWLILMLPLTTDTHGLISREILRHCRNAVLINAGRGAVVDESVLPDALNNGWLRGAALDVFETEPLPSSSPLWNDERVLISPHISGITTMNGAITGFLECLTDLENGRLPKWAVDRSRQY